MTVREINVQNGEVAEREYTTQEIEKNATAKAEAESRITYVEKRLAEYPLIGDQLDAILKGFNQIRLNGTDLPADLDSIVNKWLAVKAKHPKPEDE